MRRDWLALILTVLMLSSGCLGILDGEEEDSSEGVDVFDPPSVMLYEPEVFTHNQSVIITGHFDDESGSTLEIIGSTANGAIFNHATYLGLEDQQFRVDMGILPSGTHRIVVTATNAHDHSDSEIVFVTVLEPPEDPVVISAFPPVLYVEGGESTIARAKILHSALNTCSGIWED